MSSESVVLDTHICPRCRLDCACPEHGPGGIDAYFSDGLCEVMLACGGCARECGTAGGAVVHMCGGLQPDTVRAVDPSEISIEVTR